MKLSPSGLIVTLFEVFLNNTNLTFLTKLSELGCCHTFQQVMQQMCLVNMDRILLAAGKHTKKSSSYFTTILSTAFGNIQRTVLVFIGSCGN